MEVYFEETNAGDTCCVRCSDEIETWGIIKNIVPTYLCRRCCRHSRKSTNETTGGPYTVSQGQALTHYGCTKEDLCRIHYTVCRDSAGIETGKLYLAAEVDYLGFQRNLRRKEKLEELLGVQLADMDPLLRIYLLDDYFQRAKGKRTTLQDVLNRFAVLPRVVQILMSDAMADPGAAFDFCVAHTTAGPMEFQQAKADCRMAFRIIGDRVMKQLTLDDHSRLRLTELKDAVEDYYEHQNEISAATNAL